MRTTKLDKKGRFAVRVRQSAPTTYSARFETVASNPVAVAVRPGLDVAVPRSGMLGRPLVVRAVLRPRSSGTLHVRVWRSGHELPAKDFGGRAVVHLSTKRIASYVVRITATPTGAFVGRQKTVRTNVFLPYLADGAHGPSVRILERRLAQLHYLAARSRQLLLVRHRRRGARVPEGERPGANRPRHAARLAPAPVRAHASAAVPVRAPHRGRQVEAGAVRGRPTDASSASCTCRPARRATRPVGLWHIYSKVPGTLPTGMFDSNFFLRGVRDPRLPVRAHVSRLPRLRAHADLGGPDPLRLELLRRADLHLLLASPCCWAGSWPRLSSSSSSCRTERATRSPGATSAAQVGPVLTSDVTRRLFRTQAQFARVLRLRSPGAGRLLDAPAPARLARPALEHRLLGARS